MADQPITNVFGIGETTAENFRRKIRKSRPTSKIGDVPTVSEVSRNKGVAKFVFNIKQKEALKEAGARVRFTPEEKQRLNKKQSQSRVGDVSKNSNVGDFRILNADRKEAYEFHQDRPALNQEQDEERRARITTDVDKWKSDPNSFDFPGIDTPSRKPRRQEKDKGFVDTTMLLRPFDSDEDDDNDNSDMGIPGL
jgi:hypothetical protein